MWGVTVNRNHLINAHMFSAVPGTAESHFPLRIPDTFSAHLDHAHGASTYRRPHHLDHAHSASAYVLPGKHYGRCTTMAHIWDTPQQTVEGAHGASIGAHAVRWSAGVWR